MTTPKPTTDLEKEIMNLLQRQHRDHYGCVLSRADGAEIAALFNSYVLELVGEDYPDEVVENEGTGIEKRTVLYLVRARNILRQEIRDKLK
jgi:hypothetical protein